MIVRDKFVLNLRLYRKIKGLTQQQVADGINVSNRQYQRLENGESDPTLTNLESISKFYKLKISELIDLDINAEPTFKILDKSELSKFETFNQFDFFLQELISDFTGGDELSFILGYQKFIDLDLLCYLSDLEYTIINPAGSAFFPESMIMKKNRSGQSWENQANALSVLNRMVLRENISHYFKLEPIHVIGEKRYRFLQIQKALAGGKHKCFIIGYVEQIELLN